MTAPTLNNQQLSPDAQPSRSGRSFQINLVLAFVSLIIISVLTIAVHTYFTNRRIILNVSRALVSQTANTVTSETIRYLSPAIQSTQYLKNCLDKEEASILGDTLASNTEQLNAMQRIMHASPTLAMLYLGDSDGRFLSVNRQSNGKLVTRFIFIKNQKRWERWIYPEGDQPPTEHQGVRLTNYDPRLRPWYQGATQNRCEFWTPLYLFATTRTPGVTYSLPLLNAAGAVTSVFGADLTTETLSDFLQTIRVGNEGIAFIVNSEEKVVAYPNRAQLIPRNSKSFQPISVSELNEPWIVAAVDAYQKNTHSAKWRFISDGKAYLVQLKNLPPKSGSDWTVVVIAPEDDFVGEIKQSHQISFIIMLLILLVAVITGLRLARSISRPIEALAKEMHRVRNFELNSTLEITSPIREIQQMVSAFSSMRRGLASFGSYVPVHLVRHLLKDGLTPTPGGKTRCMTLLFSDIKGFTTLSRTVSPEALMIDLSEYFACLSQIISSHNGVVDKYMGDGLMAFWNAPEGDEFHAEHACQAALDCQKAIFTLNRQRTEQGKAAFITRIGIHTDEVVVGNMGGSDRLNYTVIGNGVNMASRLEGANKELNTSILISEATRAHLSPALQKRLVDQGEITVRGLEEATHIYSLPLPNDA